MDETSYSGFQREEPNDPDQFLQHDRLLDVVLEPSAQDTGLVFGPGESGERGRRRRPPALERQAANLADEPVAALARHRQVADEDVWAFALQGLERLIGRADSRYSCTAAFEHRDDPDAEALVVVDHKDIDASEIHIIVGGVGPPHIVTSQTWAIHEGYAKRHGVARPRSKMIAECEHAAARTASYPARRRCRRASVESLGFPCTLPGSACIPAR